MSSEHAEPKRPVLRVISGNPTEEELAAILAIVASATPEAEPEPRVSLWNDYSRGIHSTPRPSPTAWRASTMPQ
ncbi:MAG: acyl-CoA carboxylase subunit epsilon [Actinomycetota bacterium]|nr:acyl-CoA carboxylase subunit epsilon [Actinomycetota bacterium]MDP2289194.1 acyl-CoA carboxylase subunit epsilon [Actinomycetota bacterium]